MAWYKLIGYYSGGFVCDELTGTPERIGDNAHKENSTVSASGNNSHAEGINTSASGAYSHAEGSGCTASGLASHAEGNNTLASGDASHAEGLESSALTNYSYAGGGGCKVEGIGGTAFGSGSIAYGVYSSSYGRSRARANYSTSYGSGVGSVNSYGGTLITPSTHTLAEYMSAYFAYGNTFKIDGSYFKYTKLSTTGADYAEMFEWADGNPDNEDRVGHFVTLCDGNKIRYAEKWEKPIGVVSATPAVLGDEPGDAWGNAFLKDNMGRVLTEKQLIRDELGDGLFDEHVEDVYITNPEYDSSIDFKARNERPEWDAIGFMGKLIVDDDGTCEVGGKCTVGDGGIATAGDDFYVIKRIDETTIKILGCFL